MGGSPGELSEELVTYEKRKKSWRMNGDVGEAAEGLENEICRAHWYLVERWGVLYYELFPRCVTNITDIYCQQPRRLADVIQEKRPTRLHELILLHDNAHQHSANLTKITIHELGWEVISHPLYSPDLAPSDFHLFRSLSKNFKELPFLMNIWSDHGLTTSSKQNHAISTGAESKNHSSVGRLL